LLTLEKPPLARIDSIEVEDAPCTPLLNFEIRHSEPVDGMYPPLPLDISICPDCERELFHPRDRRYLYPFINCTHCGPRFTILKDIPYDRRNTTMDAFSMCDRCRAEYTDPLNRRFQAQAIACPDCGPFVELRETHSQFPTSDPRIASIEIRVSAILKARRLLREGYIVAIKGPGGFQLVCDAANPYTLVELRDRKGRSDKPFAVMAADVATVSSFCEPQREELQLLTGREKPVVLLKKRSAGPSSFKVSELVAPNLDRLGVVLPHTALHHLLLNQTDPVLAREPVPPVVVTTGGNVGEAPIAIDNKDALERLSPLADAFLLHNRDIYVRAEDSVVKVDKKNTIFVRRARGYAPFLIRLPFEVDSTLAVGGEARNAFCLARDRYAVLSHDIGDMQYAETRASFEQGIQHLSHIFQIRPELVAHDLHPDYFTTGYTELSVVPRIGVQHHHAHIASCMADNGLDDRQVIGLSFDSAGYGTDGAVWGGEVLLASYADFERFAHLEYLPLPDEGAAIPFPWCTAVGYAHALRIEVDDLPFLQNIDKQALRRLRQRMDRPGDRARTSSMGRLFDAVASLIGIRNEVTYRAQAAVEMEVLSNPHLAAAKSYPYVIDQAKSEKVIRLKKLLSAIVRDVRSHESAGMIGARFHRTVSELVLQICKQARARTGLHEVVLSGDVWQNQLLLDLVRDGLKAENFLVYFHR
ncbi:MAG TPA: carbamoyltransferase HypF, partial [Anaerolineales bacterium]|nr:carbamoyltransferase HypF [Anaerolineales bacterium]